MHVPIARYHSLDAVRGIAALSVVIFHCLIALPFFSNRSFATVMAAVADHDWARAFGTAILMSPLQVLWRGDASRVFFVLSGFVLALPFLKGPVHFGDFARRRLIRIYVPYLAAVALGAVGVAVLYNGVGSPELTAPFNAVWSQPIGDASLLDQVFMLGQEQYNFYDPPTWSLVHQMRISLVFPVVVWACTRFGLRGAIAILIALYASCLTADLELTDAPQFVHSLLQTGRYTAFFMVGVLVAVHRQTLVARFHATPTWGRMAIVGGSVVIWAYTHLLPFALRAIPVAFGTALWIVVALQSHAHHRFLTSAVPQWLGRVSYSLYLTHALVIVALVYTLGNVIGAQTAVVVSPLFALAFAEVFYRCVEMPAIRAGHRIGCIAAPPRPAPLVAEKV